MRVLLAAVIAGLWESVRETWPDSEETAGAFVAGMAWAFLIFFGILVFVTWLWSTAAGVPL
jgi:hypothetical protein